jgi:hypothetical protein
MDRYADYLNEEIQMNTNRLTLSIIILSTILMASCAPAATELTGAERDAVLAYSESKTDKLMTAINTEDYSAFTENMDDAMLKAFPEKGFLDLYTQLSGKLGAYQSRSVNDVIAQKGFVSVVYLVKFEKADVVKMRVVFRDTDPYQISGLWFDAPELR